MSFFQSLATHLSTLVSVEATALGLSQAAGHDTSPGSDHAKLAAKSAWDFLLANVPEMAQVADIVAVATGNGAVVPAINAAAGFITTGKVVASLNDGHANVAQLASSVAQLSSAVQAAAHGVDPGASQKLQDTAGNIATIAANIAGQAGQAGQDTSVIVGTTTF